MKNTKKICIVTLSLVFLFIAISMTAVCIKANTEDPKLEIRYCNLSFRDSVCIKYAVSAKNTTDVKILIWNSPQSDYTIGTESEQITSVGKNIIDGEDYVIFDYSKLVAKQMTDVVYARAYTQMDGVDYYSDVNKYSILQYAYNKLGKTATESTDENLKVMLTDMLEYGASAQKYFEHNSDRLATDCFYQVKLTDGVLYDGCTHGLYLEGDKVELSAPEKNSDDVAFSYWADSKGNKVSTTSTFELTVGTSNEVYTPIYNEATKYLVTFKDYDGTVLKTENVEFGNAATPPENPYRNGYTFTGWDKTYNNITSDLIVTATYTQNSSKEYTVTFVDYDGTTLATKSVSSGATAELPANPSKNGATFLGWSGNYANVTQNETVTAVYSDTKNVFVVESTSGSVGDTINVLISVDGSVKTCGFDFTLFYDSSLELVSYDDDLDVSIIVNDSLYTNGIKLNFSDAKDKTKQRDIIELTFKIKETTQTALPIWIDMKEVFEVMDSGTIENASYTIVNGVVKVQ